MRLVTHLLLGGFLAACACQSVALAASRTLTPGEVWGMGEDLVLSGDDVLEARSTADHPCRIDANTGTIRTAPDWHGRVVLRYCELRGLGGVKKPALDLTASGSGEQIVIEHCDFHACGAIHLANEGESATVFRHNRLRDTSMVPVTNLPDESAPIFRATGRSAARKVFQGNRVERSIVEFSNARNWMVGGVGDGEGNVITGLRGSLTIGRSDGIEVRGNYVHTEIPSFRWSQVHTLAVEPPCEGLVVEHNVLRHGQWVVRSLCGEFRYNLVLDADGHDFIIGPAGGTKIHHNIFARYCTVDPNLNATIAVIYRGDGIEIFNNTFDGGGPKLARPWHVPAIEVNEDGFVASLRNNAFVNHPTRFFNGTATIRPGFNDKIAAGAGGPARLGYADYNLFYNPDAEVRRNYGLSVASRTERTDDGFAKHDVPAGGAKDAQAEPKFRGPVPSTFPFDDEDLRAGKVTALQVLAAYRAAYAPDKGSPLFGAGDPADGGAASFTGAVGPGGADAPAADRFGRPAPAR